MMDRCAAREKPFDTNLAAFCQLHNIGSTYFEGQYGMRPFWFARCLRLPIVKQLFMNYVDTGSGSGV